MIDATTKGKHCNDSCCDYYCPQNVSGRCQAPNKCLGVEEAAELMAELEAAKREIAALRKRGDCAKLREAIAKCVNSITEFGNAEIVKTPLDVIIDIEAILKAALAAPPRNCDVYDSYGDAIRAFEDAENAEDYEDVAEWLYAPATEQEGGDK